MEQKIVEKIFESHGLGKVKSVANIEIGFTNKIYLVNDSFILKVCEDESNEQKFETEVFFYNFFKDKISVPKISVFDKSKSIYGKFFKFFGHILFRILNHSFDNIQNEIH